MLLFALGVGFSAAGVRADANDDRRVRIGTRLFRATLAADLALESKAAADGSLTVLVYAGDGSLADEIGRLIAEPAAPGQSLLRGMPIRVRPLDRLPLDGPAPAALFLASSPSADELDRLIRWSIEQRVILYSPFEGHVERGVMSGLSIEAKVQPFVNLESLAAGGVELKPLFLKVAKAHR